MTADCVWLWREKPRHDPTPTHALRPPPGLPDPWTHTICVHALGKDKPHDARGALCPGSA